MTQANENLTPEQIAAAAAEKAAAPKLTYAEKRAKRVAFLYARIVSDTAEYNNLSNEINNADALKNLVVGDKITIKQGRKFADKDTTRIVEASILGVSVQEDGSTLYKVTFGEGFDADVAVVNAGAILSVIPKAVEGEVEAAA